MTRCGGVACTKEDVDANVERVRKLDPECDFERGDDRRVEDGHEHDHIEGELELRARRDDQPAAPRKRRATVRLLAPALLEVLATSVTQ